MSGRRPCGNRLIITKISYYLCCNEDLRQGLAPALPSDVLRQTRSISRCLCPGSYSAPYLLVNVAAEINDSATLLSDGASGSSTKMNSSLMKPSSQSRDYQGLRLPSAWGHRSGWVNPGSSPMTRQRPETGVSLERQTVSDECARG